MTIDWYEVANKGIGGGGAALAIFALIFLFNLLKKLVSEGQRAVSLKADTVKAGRTNRRPEENTEKQRQYALRAAQYVLDRAGPRSDVTPSNVLAYDFFIAAARTAIEDLEFAERIGRRMPGHTGER